MMGAAVHSRRARPALARLPEIDPAVAALSLWCVHRDDPEPTRTREDTIFYGPEFEGLRISEKVGLVAHHVLHVALRHSARAGAMRVRMGSAFDADTFNLVSDALINEALLEAGHALPRPAVRAQELLAGMPEHRSTIPTLLSTWDTERLYLALSAQGASDRMSERNTAATYTADRAFRPDLEQGEARGGAPETWRGRCEQALSAGRSAGTGIGAILGAFADLPDARVPWETVLRRQVLRAVSDVPRKSNARPSGRWIARDADAMSRHAAAPVFEPGLTRNRKRQRAVIALDSSSSISAAQLRLFAAEALSVSRRTGAEAHLLAFDTEVYASTILREPNDLLRLTARQGGGTDFRPMIGEATALDPSILVVLTDLDAPAGDAPAFPVIWAVPDHPQQEAPFGTLLVMAG